MEPGYNGFSKKYERFVTNSVDVVNSLSGRIDEVGCNDDTRLSPFLCTQ